MSNKYQKTDRIFIRTNRTGYIPSLRMYGPIVRPFPCSVGVCQEMLTFGIELYQVEPKSNEVVQLTLLNLYDKDKFGKKADKKAESKNVETKAPEIKSGVPKKETPKEEKEEVPVQEEIHVAEESETVAEEVKEEEVKPAEEKAEKKEEAPVNEQKKNKKK